MGLFIVDRVPLVFQQGAAISMETQLRVCRVCGENKTKATMRELQDSLRNSQQYVLILRLP